MSTSSKRHPRTVQMIRLGDRFFDALGLRPIGIVVFGISTILFFHLIGRTAGTMTAEGVAVAGRVDHPAPVSSFVTRTFAKVGDRVVVGAPLVELSPMFIDQALARVSLSLEQLQQQSTLLPSDLVVYSNQDGRAVSGVSRFSGSEDAAESIEALTRARYAAEIEVLAMRQARLLGDREALIVKSNFAGIVSRVTWLGASVSERDSVASIIPEFAEEIVAYVAATTDASAISNGVAIDLLGAQPPECQSPGRVRGRGAEVEQAPGQLRGVLGTSVHGMPVHIKIPSDCRLVNGQVLSLNFRNEIE